MVTGRSVIFYGIHCFLCWNFESWKQRHVPHSHFQSVLLTAPGRIGQINSDPDPQHWYNYLSHKSCLRMSISGSVHPHHPPWRQNDIFTKTTSLAPEVSLTVPDFTISVCGSSCHCLFSGLILFSFLSLTFSWHFILPCGCQKIERESKKPRMKARMRPKQRKMNELLYTEMAKSGTIGLASGLLLPDGGGSWWWGCAGWRLSWRRIWWESWRPAGWPPPPAAPPYLSQIQSWARVSKIMSHLAPVRLFQTVSRLALSQTNSRH